MSLFVVGRVKLIKNKYRVTPLSEACFLGLWCYMAASLKGSQVLAKLVTSLRQRGSSNNLTLCPNPTYFSCAPHQTWLN